MVLLMIQKLLMLSQTALTEVLYNIKNIKNCILQWPVGVLRPTFYIPGRTLMHLNMVKQILDAVFMAELLMFLRQRR